FCTYGTVSTLELSTGTIGTLGALNTSDYTYDEVVIAPDAVQLYIVTVEGSFSASTHHNRGRGRDGNMPMFVTANSVLDGTQMWRWNTNESFLTVVSQQVICFVTTGGPAALWTKNGLLAASAVGGQDYREPAPPLLYQGTVWYYATEFFQEFCFPGDNQLHWGPKWPLISQSFAACVLDTHQVSLWEAT
ncbi:Hypothetical protein, putative, partial [Bodo saltans]